MTLYANRDVPLFRKPLMKKKMWAGVQAQFGKPKDIAKRRKIPKMGVGLVEYLFWFQSREP